MTTSRGLLTGCVVLGLLVTGCGGGDDGSATSTTETSIVAETTAPSTAPPTTEVEATVPSTAPETTEPTPTTAPEGAPGDLCAALSSDAPPADLADLVPSEHVDAARLISEIVEPMDSFSSIPIDVLERFVDPAGTAALNAFADDAEAQCGQVPAVDGLRFYAGVSELGAPAADDAYCAPLADIVALETDDETTRAALAAALPLAPAEHVVGLEIIQSLLDAQGALPDGFDPMIAVQAIAGLGLYAEVRCGAPDAFASMMLVGAFLSDPEGLGGEPGAGLGAVPDPADASAATAAVPAGSGVTFQVLDLDLNDDGSYLASAVVPVGWELDDSSFGKTFEPTEGFGIFTEISFDTGCDGLCEVTDWDARLNGDDGYITLYRADNEMIVDRPTEGSPGVVLVKPGFGDGTNGAVIRWADGVDHYFICDFQLEAEDVGLVDAFVAACESSVPGWITAA